MRYVPEPLPVDVVPELDDAMRATLAGLRAEDGFGAAAVADAKAREIADYLGAAGLSGVVVAVSGGVDSAVALGLVVRAASLPGSAVRRVVPLLLPVDAPGAASGQAEATRRGRAVCEAFGVQPAVIDLAAAHAALVAAVDAGLGGEPAGRWARGQAVATLRTPAYYLVTSILTARGEPALVAGTTNRPEGELGYYGKASDGLVDLQLLSDLWKSEVVSLAQFLGVPGGVIDAVPTGDMWDGRTDERLFGCPYDFVELRLRLLGLGLAGGEGWDGATQAAYDAMAERLDGLRRYNAHKFTVGSPAVHLDVLDRPTVGWSYRRRGC